jgi:hypothetical protein
MQAIATRLDSDSKHHPMIDVEPTPIKSHPDIPDIHTPSQFNSASHYLNATNDR